MQPREENRIDHSREKAVVPDNKASFLPNEGEPLTHRESSYRTLFEASLDAVLLTKPDGSILEANPAACKLLGRTCEELRKVGRSGVVDISDPRLAVALEKRSRTGKFWGELTFVRADGSKFAGEISTAIFQDTNGEWLTSMVIRDLTQSKIIEQKLRDFLEFNQGVLDALANHICVVDVEGAIVAVNVAWRKFADENPPLVPRYGLGLNYFTICKKAVGQDANEATTFAAGMQEVLNGVRDYFKMQYSCHSPGQQRWFIGHVTRLSRGGIINLVVSHENITERKLLEDALLQKEVYLSTLLNSIGDATFTVNLPERRIVYINRAMTNIFGYSQSELIGHTTEQLYVSRAEYDAYGQRIADALIKGGALVHAELKLRRKDGREFYADVQTAFIKNDNPPMQVISLVRDITERKNSIEALKQSELRYRAVVQDQTEVICRFSEDGTILFANDVYCRFFGKSLDELIGKKWQPVAFSEDVVHVEAHLRSLSVTNPVVVVENRVYSASGHLCWMQFVNRAFFDEQGHLLEIQCVGRDITERKQATDALHSLSSKLLTLQDEERRHVARELHDATAQELAALSMNLSLLRLELPKAAANAYELLDRSLHLTEKCSTEIRTLAYLLHPPILDELGLAGAVRDYADGFARRSGIRVDMELPAVITRLPREVELALFRVMQEALTNVHRHANSRTVSINVKYQNQMLRMEIRDKGHGFPTLVAFGRKDLLLQGMGVGIPGMRERLRLLGGQLEIESGSSGTSVIAIVPLVGQHTGHDTHSSGG